MKLTQSQLRRIIKEELKNALNEAGNDEAQVAADMAAALAKVPAVQAAVERAQQDPDVQAALADLMASAGIKEAFRPRPLPTRVQDTKQVDLGAKMGLGGSLLGIAGLLATSPAAAPLMALVAPMAVPIGLTGVALLAMGTLIVAPAAHRMATSGSGVLPSAPGTGRKYYELSGQMDQARDEWARGMPRPGESEK